MSGRNTNNRTGYGGGGSGSSLPDPVTVAHGGTGLTTITNHGVLIGQAASNVAATTAGTAGFALISNGASADPSFQAIARNVQIVLADPATTVTTGTNVAYWRVPAALNGAKLTAVAASVSTVSSSGLPTVTITNATGSVAILSTALTIDANETDSSTAATPAVVNGSNNTLATGDQIQLNVTVAGTGTKGLLVDLVITPQ